MGAEWSLIVISLSGSIIGQDKDSLVTSELQTWLARIVCGECQADKQAQLVLANALLVKMTRDKVREEFLKNMIEAGRVEKEESANSIYHVQFSHKEATERINKWANKTTGGMIKDIVKPDQLNADTVMVLINILYFNGGSICILISLIFILILIPSGQWKTKFSPGDTVNTVFHAPSGDKEVEMMYKKEEMEFGYDSEIGFSWVELPYVGNKFAMIAYLPTKGGPNTIQILEVTSSS